MLEAAERSVYDATAGVSHSLTNYQSFKFRPSGRYPPSTLKDLDSLSFQLIGALLSFILFGVFVALAGGGQRFEPA